MKTALIIGTGPGISIAFGKKLVEAGYRVAVASRDLVKLTKLAQTIGAEPFQVDCSQAPSIVDLFTAVETAFGGAPEVVLYNASGGMGTSGECGTIDYAAVSKAMEVTSVGAFVATQEAGKRMIPKGRGCIFLTGATAGVKGFPKRSVFAMGKFALRGMAQAMYKELSPQGIHVCHFIIDGGVRPFLGETLASLPSDAFTAEAVATSYMLALAQPSGAWSWEIELRPKNENF
jgi:NAD(P)-dependent dehydrogenase (short-subunit alcohol dehydrogenase family)